MIIAGLDPGNVQSALVLFDSEKNLVIESSLEENAVMMNLIIDQRKTIDKLVIERVASYGMSVGETIFETVFWSGRFAQLCSELNIVWDRITRNEIKNNICHSSKAKDTNIRQALIDKFGEVGTKKHPGPLFGISKDKWAALAVAVAYLDIHGTK